MAPDGKTFVLDTNVILHDSSCIDFFEENDIVIPVTVLEELDGFKKGNDILNYHAREFLRRLDQLSGDKLFNGGVRIGPDRGRIMVKLEQEFHADLKRSFSEEKSDHRILNIAYGLSLDTGNGRTVLVSKDVNLRLKAKSLGLIAQDYRTDHVQNIAELYKGHRRLESVSDELIDNLHSKPFEFPADEMELEKPLTPNEYMVLRNASHSVLAVYDPALEMVRRVDKRPAFGVQPRNAEQVFALDALLNPEIQLVTLTGKAGTGKTLLALAAALQMKKRYRQIYMARPVVPLSNKDLGFLPGDIQSKLAPYMQPLYDNLGVIRHAAEEHKPRADQIQSMLDSDKLVIAPLAYIRGRSLVKIFFIVDEAQNLTPHEIKTILTRAGEDTKVVLTGDIYQIDHPYLDTQSNGLSVLIEKMQGQKLYAHINLEKGERSVLSEMVSNLL
ncbi:PhoH family protein [bacterium]|nr:PhoH family protein [bacterium]